MADIDRKDPKYKKARRKINAWMGFVQALAAATNDEEDDEYAVLLADIVNVNFDEAWAIHHPKPPKK